MAQEAEKLLAEFIEIRTPQMLVEVAKSLSEFIEMGLLKEISQDISVREILDGPPFPDDLINIEFVTVPGGSKYLLSCETYKGFGGIFKKMTP